MTTPSEPRTVPPASPLPPGYRPAGGVPHKVVDSDSWWTLARDHGVDVWWLIQYNFETRDPAVVNWYLKHRVGCTRTTGDRRNYRFSGSDRPGVVHVPAPAVVGALAGFKYGSYGIRIEGDDDYRRQVESTIAWFARSDTGRVLLDGIRRTGRTVVVSPWAGTDCNATAVPASYRDAGAAGEALLKGGGSFEQLTEPSLVRDFLGLPHELAIGTGKGSDVTVRFSPTMFGYGAKGACAPHAGAPGASPSQVLFHELAHAYRAASGKFHLRPTVGGSVGHTNMEEFFAVVLSNVLTADPTYDTGNRTLRADHAGFAPLAPHLSTSRGFASQVPNRNKLRELVAGEPLLAAALRGVRSRFNPFAEPL